VSGASQKEDGN